MEPNNRNTQQENNTVDIKDLIALCLKNWYWFVASVIICLGVVTFYLLKTPSQYTRTAEILIKNDRKGKSISSAAGGDFSDLGLFSSVSNVNNEIHAIKSVSNMTEVVKRLHLNTNYSIDGRFHEQVLYGTNLPVSVIIPEDEADVSRSFDIQLKEDGSFMLANFVLKDEELEGDKSIHQLGDTLITPVGTLIVAPSNFFSTAKMDETIHVRISKIYSAVSKYAAKLNVALSDTKSEVIHMSVEDISTQRAEDILNTVIDVYNENWVKDKNQIALSTSDFISDRLSVIEAELSAVDSDISAYKSSNLVTDVATASNIYMTQSTNIESKITELQNQLYMAKYIRDYLNSDTIQLLPANAGITNTTIGNQINEYNAQVIDRNNLVAASSEQNPLVKELDATISSLRKTIQVSIDNEVLSLQNQINSLNASNRQNKSKIAANPTQAKYLLSVERQQSVKEALYIYLLQKREENELSQAFTAYNTQIIDEPFGSPNPTSPSKAKLLLLGLLLGLMIPFGVIYLLAALNTKVRGKADIKSLTLPFLGEIPQLDSKKIPSLKKIQKMAKKGKIHKNAEGIIAVKSGGRDVVNEAFRVLRTNTEFISQDKSKNVIIITSMNAGSGKSFITMNLGMALAIKDKKVLVIDGDFRHASSSQYVNRPKVGFCDYLAGKKDTYKDTIISFKDQPNLSVLPVGTIPPNPTELIADAKFAAAIQELKSEYDYVFIDCPPIDILADTQIIEKSADRTLFVIRAKLFERALLPEVQQAYTDNRFKNMALILNGTEATGKYGYRYGYRYGYGYGQYASTKSEN